RSSVATSGSRRAPLRDGGPCPCHSARPLRCVGRRRGCRSRLHDEQQIVMPPCELPGRKHRGQEGGEAHGTIASVAAQTIELRRRELAALTELAQPALG